MRAFPQIAALVLAACGGSGASGDNSNVEALQTSLSPADRSNIKPAGITSVHTILDLDRCKLIKTDEFEGRQYGGTWRCKGFAGVPLTVLETSERYDVYPGTGMGSKFNTGFYEFPPGESVEWRLFRGTPFAIIYQLNVREPGTGKLLYSRLIVSTVSTERRPACRIAEFDRADAKAKAGARAAADRVLTGAARCLSIPLDLVPQLDATDPARLSTLTTAYTTVDQNHCKPAESDPGNRRRLWRCKGYADNPLFVQEIDGHYDVSAAESDGYGAKIDGIGFPHNTTEWRVSLGKAYAIIYRLAVQTESKGRVKKSSRLIVESVGDPFGCRVAEVDAAAPYASSRARAEADKILTDDATCLEEDRYGD